MSQNKNVKKLKKKKAGLKKSFSKLKFSFTFRPQPFRVALALAALGCLVVSVLPLYNRLKASRQSVLLPTATVVVSVDTPEPQEKAPEPAVADDYEVPADMPRRIIIPKIAIDHLVQKVGLTQAGVIAVPTNINYAGWFNGSALPGEKGISIIDGHVSGVYNDGIFKSLHTLVAGDFITVEFGDKSKRIFKVVAVRSLPEVEATEYLYKSYESVEAQLNLVTCGGSFDKASQTYRNRVIVTAERIL